MAKQNEKPLRTKRPRAASKVQERIALEKKQFIELLNQNSGIISATCRAAKISRYTFYEWYNKDTEFAELVDDVKELQKDFCEAAILKKIREGDSTMIIFYAKTQMKDRGYNERREVTGADGAALFKPDIDLSKLTPEQREALLKLGENTLSETKD